MITKIVTKIRQPLVITNLDEWVDMFEKTNKLPSTNIPCSVCTMGITATHGNLLNKVAKYGGIRNLLTKFVCKTCTKDGAVSSVSEKTEPNTESRKSLKRDRDIENGLAPDSHGRYKLPSINLNPSKQSWTIEQIAKDPELTKELTNGSCLKPRLFLDNDYNCSGCMLFDNCGASCKTMPKQRKLTHV